MIAKVTAVGILDSMRSRFKNKDEEEFERAFQEGAWPEGVDLEPIANTGSFLPATYDVDPLADASLPGNAARAASQDASGDAPGAGATDSVVRAAGTRSVYAEPAAPSPFQVIDGSSRPVPADAGQPRQAPRLEVVRPAAGETSSLAPAQPSQPVRPREEQAGAGAEAPRAQAARPAPAAQAPYVQPYDPPAPFVSAVHPRIQAARPEQPQPAPAPAAPRQPRERLPWELPASQPDAAPAAGRRAAPRTDQRADDFDEEGVHVVARGEGGRADRPAAPRADGRPFAERLRERVAAANVSGQGDETLGRSRAALEPVQPPAARPRRSEDATMAQIDAELEERRARRAAAASASAAARRQAPAYADEPQAGRRAPEGAAPARPRPRPEERPEAPRAAQDAAPRPVPLESVVIRARGYDDVRDVAQAVMAEHRPAVLVLRGSSGEVARRVLDFSFGLCCGTGASMQELGDRVYCVLPRGTCMTDEDVLRLRRQGLVRG